jgi:hypothetical protein
MALLRDDAEVAPHKDGQLLAGDGGQLVVSHG